MLTVCTFDTVMKIEFYFSGLPPKNAYPQSNHGGGVGWGIDKFQ